MKRIALSLLLALPTITNAMHHNIAAPAPQAERIGDIDEFNYITITNNKSEPLCCLSRDLAHHSGLLKHILKAQSEEPNALPVTLRNLIKLDVEESLLCDVLKSTNDPKYMDYILDTEHGIRYAHTRLIPIINTLKIDPIKADPLRTKITQAFKKLRLLEMQSLESQNLTLQMKTDKALLALCKIIDVNGKPVNLTKDQSSALIQCKTFTSAYSDGIRLDFSVLRENEDFSFLTQETIMQLLDILCEKAQPKDLSRAMLGNILYAADYLGVPERWPRIIAEEYLKKTKFYLQWLAIPRIYNNITKTREFAHNLAYEKCMECKKYIQANDETTMLECSHQFHTPCIRKYYDRFESCRLCATKISEHLLYPLTSQQKLKYYGSKFIDGAAAGFSTISWPGRAFTGSSVTPVTLYCEIVTVLGKKYDPDFPFSQHVNTITTGIEGIWGIYDSMSTYNALPRNNDFLYPLVLLVPQNIFRHACPLLGNLLKKKSISLSSDYNYNLHNQRLNKGVASWAC